MASINEVWNKGRRGIRFGGLEIRLGGFCSDWKRIIVQMLGFSSLVAFLASYIAESIPL